MKELASELARLRELEPPEALDSLVLERAHVALAETRSSCERRARRRGEGAGLSPWLKRALE